MKNCFAGLASAALLAKLGPGYKHDDPNNVGDFEGRLFAGSP